MNQKTAKRLYRLALSTFKPPKSAPKHFVAGQAYNPFRYYVRQVRKLYLTGAA